MNDIPVSSRNVCKICLNASKPPADAPIPTTNGGRLTGVGWPNCGFGALVDFVDAHVDFIGATVDCVGVAMGFFCLFRDLLRLFPHCFRGAA